jgi:hypothetical protein
VPPDSQWTLVRFDTALDDWERMENPPPDLLIIINAWLMELLDNALVGQRMSDFPGWRFAVIPGTHNGTDMVTCIFQADERTKVAKCSFYAYQTPPFGPA